MEKSDHYWEQLKTDKYVIHFDEVKENEEFVEDLNSEIDGKFLYIRRDGNE